MATVKKGLGPKGKGLEALIENSVKVPSAGVLELDLNKIEPSVKQPRKYFDETALTELAASIKEYGVIQPIIVKKSGDSYRIIAGERRFRASKIAGLEKIPAIIKDADGYRSFEMALVENLQRSDLNPIEEAESYKKLSEEFGLSQEQIAEKVGKNRSTVTNSMRLLNLAPRVLELIEENKLSGGHARTLLGVEDPEKQYSLALLVIENGLSVRETERAVKRINESPSEAPPRPELEPRKTYRKLESDLRSIFGTKVSLKSGKNKGKIEIEFYSEQDLDRILDIIKSLD